MDKTLVAIAVAAMAVAAGCSRRDRGASGADTSKRSADSITTATVGKPGASPSGEPAKPSGSTTLPPQGGTKSASKSGRAGGGATLNARPRLTKLTPSSGSVTSGEIITVQVAGDRFTATGNSIFFGSTKLGDVASTDGRTIRFAVPQTVPSRGEVPPMAIQPGAYGVYVVNANGTSDTLTFTIKNQQP